ncbi:MAG: electron transporter RnfC, partial [Clostridia bacterium]|nr:electron transporter RnfC [Clostridia bacterium]
MAFFRGGIHPADGKEYAKSKPMVKIAPGSELVFPMSQHIGAPALPAVQKGDQVLMGQVIGKAAGFVSANIVSSVSGTVKAIEPRPLINGSQSLSVVIENDGLDTPAEGLGVKRDYTAMSREEILQAIKEAGIVGMGGACFPSHVKLSVKDPNEVEYVLINGSECEPYLTS